MRDGPKKQINSITMHACQKKHSASNKDARKKWSPLSTLTQKDRQIHRQTITPRPCADDSGTNHQSVVDHVIDGHFSTFDRSQIFRLRHIFGRACCSWLGWYISICCGRSGTIRSLSRGEQRRFSPGNCCGWRSCHRFRRRPWSWPRH